MVEHASLSEEHYLRQADELIISVMTARDVERALNKSLSAARKLGLGKHVNLLKDTVQILLDASALLDDAIMMLCS